MGRGWRVTAPNLEQTGLLEIRYDALDQLVEAEDVWAPLGVPAVAPLLVLVFDTVSYELRMCWDQRTTLLPCLPLLLPVFLAV